MSRWKEDSGETLVEILVTIVVIAIGLVAVVAELGSTIVASDAQSSMAGTEVVIRDYADVVKAKAATPVAVASYVRCPDATVFKPSAAEFTPPNGWRVDITKVEYWIPGNNFPDGSFTNPGPDPTLAGTPAGGGYTQTDCVNYMKTLPCVGAGGSITNCDPRFDPGYWRLTLRAYNARTDYGQEDFKSTILVRRGNRT